MGFQTYSYKDSALNGYFELSKAFDQWSNEVHRMPNLIHMLWNPHSDPVDLIIDGKPFELGPQQVVTITFLHKLLPGKRDLPLISFSFNREFYCIHDHDHEVSCNGIIFFGTQDIPIIQLDEVEQRRFDLLYQVFMDEFETRDNIQGEMLRMLLKRLIIKVTRLAKEQLIQEEMSDAQIELIRQYNFLVDMHFREKKSVKEYADLLYKSPKTLANLFKIYNQKTPLRIIHERIVLEARRLLTYTDKSVKEIGFELGFEEAATFHKLFKKITGQSPKAFRGV